MAKSNYTHLTLIVDRSGSMDSVQAEAQSGLNTLLVEQRLLPGDLTVTLTQFDTEVETIQRMQGESFEYELVPRGMTALLDAVGSEIVRTGEDLAALPEADRPEKVLVVVVTDGAENSSHEYSLEKVREMVSHQRDTYNWDFQFIGAGEAAWQGSSLGMNSAAYSGTAAGTRAAYGSMSASLGAYRAAPVGAVFAMPDVIDDDEETPVSL